MVPWNWGLPPAGRNGTVSRHSTTLSQWRETNTNRLTGRATVRSKQTRIWAHQCRLTQEIVWKVCTICTSPAIVAVFFRFVWNWKEWKELLAPKLPKTIALRPQTRVPINDKWLTFSTALVWTLSSSLCCNCCLPSLYILHPLINYAFGCVCGLVMSALAHKTTRWPPTAHALSLCFSW